MPLALLALTLSAFVIGTTEFVFLGLVTTMTGKNWSQQVNPC